MKNYPSSGHTLGPIAVTAVLCMTITKALKLMVCP